MALPNDPIMLLSMVNLKLRDFYPHPSTHCATIWMKMRPRCAQSLLPPGMSTTPREINSYKFRRLLP